MKKLLGIVVLGLLLSGNAYAADKVKIKIFSKDENHIRIKIPGIGWFKTRDLRNEFVEKTKGMEKTQREEIYKQYLI